MTVYLVGAGPGDPGLLTVRGRQLLERAEVVLHDRLSGSAVLDLAPPGAEIIAVGKSPEASSTPQDEINRLLVERGRRHDVVVRLKGGDPFVFGRGGEEAEALLAAGVPFEVVPGVSSAIAVPAYGGVPVTHRGLSTSFTVVTGHEDPWAATETDWEAVARVGGTIVVLMGTATRGAIADRLLDAGMDPGTPVVAVRWGTRPDQETVRTTLAGLGQAPVRASAVIVVGAVAGLDLGWFERRPLFRRRIVVTRARAQASGLVTRLRELGADVVESPTIEVAAPGDGGAALRAAAADVGSFDWVVLTSTNAVDAFLPLLHDARSLAGVRVGAVGPATAAALLAGGVRADLVPAESSAEGLLAEFPHGPGRVLLPQAAAARATLAAGLGERGWDVTSVEAYRTVPATGTAVGAADAITFTSSSTVANFVAAHGAGAVPEVVVTIGPQTTETARTLGIEVTAQADPHTVEGVVEALVRVLGGAAGS